MQKSDEQHVVGCKASVPGCIPREQSSAELCQTVSAVSSDGDNAHAPEEHQWRYLFAGDLDVPVSVYPHEMQVYSPRVRTAQQALRTVAAPIADPQFIAWQSFGTYEGPRASRPRIFNATSPLVIAPPEPQHVDPAVAMGGTTGFALYAIAPVLDNGWILMGEPNKYVSVAFRRFSRLVTSAATGMQVSVSGAAGERVEVMVTHQTVLDVVTVTCVIASEHNSAQLLCAAPGDCQCR
eukprot:m.1187524 g.1187524  ORF g.1187524 m.1187524 type:complete len:237 (-) comp24549_c0_seq8:2752-3462(-)